MSEDGRLTMIHTTDIATLDADGNTGGTRLSPAALIYDRLIHYDPETAGFEPGLATSWEFLEDGDVLEMQLRQGVLFHDGAEFNAEVVRANFERSSEERWPYVAAFADDINEVEIIDDYTIRLHRAAGLPDINWVLIENRLAEVLGMMISPTALENPDLERNPVGAGAFELVEYGAQSITLQRFEDYWDRDNVHLEEVEVVFGVQDPNTIMNGLISGEYDLAKIDPSLVGTAEDGGLTTVVQNSWGMIQIWTNHSLPPMDDRNIRLAMEHAIDREGIVATIANGYGESTGGQPFPSNNPGHNPDVGLEYDPDLAREYLAQSEYADDMPLVRIFVQDRQQLPQIAEALQSMYEAVGLNVKLEGR